VEVAHPKERQRCGGRNSLDGSDRRVDLERLGNCDATLGAELVLRQAAERGGNKKGMIGMLLPSQCCYRRGNKSANFKVGVTHAKQRQ
jgi:hypothetical protein